MSTKQVTIIVNGRQKTVPKDEMTFREIVEIAFPGAPPPSETMVYTVAYKKGGNEKKPEGTLEDGDPPLKMKDGMIINVTQTDRS